MRSDVGRTSRIRHEHLDLGIAVAREPLQVPVDSAGVVVPAYCDEMIAELADKLRTKFRFSDGNLQAVIRDYRQIGKRSDITGELKVVDDDPTDDKFIECALVAGATRIVSGDRHLLSLKEYHGVKLITASDFLASL